MSYRNANTERTLRIMAKELAQKFYEAKRSDAFRSAGAMTLAYTTIINDQGLPEEVRVPVPFTTAYPTARHYANAHWPHFYECARKCAIGLLGQPDSRVSPHMKEAIFVAIKEDRDRQFATGGVSLLQVKREAINGEKIQ